MDVVAGGGEAGLEGKGNGMVGGETLPATRVLGS